jgi:hypothetical protein
VREIGRKGITTQSLTRLAGLGCAVVKIVGSPLQPAAVDILGVAPCGHALAIETKVPGDAAAPRQARFLATWSARGAVTGTAHSADEAEQIVKEHTCGLG